MELSADVDVCFISHIGNYKGFTIAGFNYGAEIIQE
jgi:hypothetical protein